ncbi:hypothetical protein CY652_20815 [Burkholderia sp. WAC0059]|nr:hypothetical protein CY652_20815 [Burkholderia sp. WAC0059]
MPALHHLALQTLYSSVVEGAQAQSVTFQTPGTRVQRTIRGRMYTYWRTYLASGQRHDEYLGAAGDPDTDRALEERQQQGQEARDRTTALRTLRLSGFSVADNSSALTVALLFSAGIFRQGGVLVGSHTFGALLNSLGVKLASNYPTEDGDTGTANRVALAVPGDRRVLDVLRDTGLLFLETAPEPGPRKLSTSFRRRGRPLKVDLFVPDTGDDYEIRLLPGLKMHATGLPFFEYLMEGVGDGCLLGKDRVIPVRLPAPARFALHTLAVSSLRPAELGMKGRRDLAQAVVMLDAVLAHYPGWVEEAIDALPDAARACVGLAAGHALAYAGKAGDAARDTLEDLAALAPDHESSPEPTPFVQPPV